MLTLASAIELRNNGDFQEAEKAFLALIEAHPDNALVQYHTAWCFDKMGRETAAVPYYERAIELGLEGDDLRGALLGLGSTYRTIGQYESAITILERGVAEFPDADEFATFLAMAYYNLDRHKEATTLLLKLLVKTSNSAGIQRFARAIDFYADNLDQIWLD